MGNLSEPAAVRLNTRAVEPHRARGQLHPDGLIGVIPACDPADLAIGYAHEAIAVAAAQVTIVHATRKIPGRRLSRHCNFEQSTFCLQAFDGVGGVT